MSHRELYKGVLQEALLAGSGLLVVLFVMENLKAGLVSNYVSLPAVALGMFVLACFYGSFLPPTAESTPATLDKKRLIVLSLLSLAVLLVLFSFAFPWYLTLLFCAVAWGLLWLGTEQFAEL